MNDVSENRVAFIAGAGRGIGMAVCQRLADAGFQIAAGARTVEELEKLKAEFASRDIDISCHGFDIGDAEAVDQVVQSIKQQYGRIDVLVNSAGISYVAPVAISKLDRCAEVLQTNLMGAYIISRAVVRMMMSQKSGRIIHIGSISGTIGAPYNAIYAASKAGVGGLVKSLALEVASLGITVNAVQPGTVDTELFEQTHGARAKIKGISLDEQRQAMVDENPQRRLVEMGEIAAAVAFLASEEAASINGHMLTVDGGRSIV